MCGIVGIVGKADVAQRLFDGLKRLEYRGYDSAGICTIEGGERSGGGPRASSTISRANSQRIRCTGSLASPTPGGRPTVRRPSAMRIRTSSAR